MDTPNHHEAFRPHLLSVREREVVGYAIDGLTDEQIAQALGLSTSTISSYWVRIRGKVGSLSRTEIVAKMLHLGYKDEHARMAADLDALRTQLVQTRRALATAEIQREAVTGGEWHFLALHFVPDSVLVAKASGDVIYANLHAERLLNREPGGFVGCPISELIVPEARDRRRSQIQAFLEAECPGRFVLGVEEPCYVLKGDGENFRATIVVEGFTNSHGFMAVLAIRPFLSELDEVLRCLRKPLALM